MTEQDSRNKRIRVNAKDITAAKAAQESEFTGNPPLGLVVRLACNQLVDEDHAELVNGGDLYNDSTMSEKHGSTDGGSGGVKL